MIIDEIVSIKVRYLSKDNKNYYSSIGYDLSNSTLDVKVNDLTVSSKVKINVSCDICNKESNISYSDYNRNISHTNKFSCCKECTTTKLKEYNIEKYGVDNVSKIESVKDKRINTLIEKYGVDNISKVNNIKEKKKSTNISKYGVDNYAKSNDYKERIVKLNNENYGVDHFFQSDLFKQKYINTINDKYGVNHYSNTFDFKEKLKKSFLYKYGVEHIFQSDKIKEKSKITNLSKYDVEYYSQSDIYKEKVKNLNISRYGVLDIQQSEKYRAQRYDMCKDSNYISYIGNNISLYRCDCKLCHDFEISTTQYYNRKDSNIPLCTICYPIDDNKSIKEELLLEYVQSIYSGKVIFGYRDGLEIDIYLPELNIGFEFNGLYWHSSLFLDRNYHLNKQEYFKEKGIRIIYIWEDDWDYKTDIIKSQIKNWLGLNNHKIYARKCTVKVIDNVDIVRNFLNNNHIQGFVSSVIKIGLYYNGELVSIITFDKFEGRKLMNNGYNLSRFCNKLNTNVIGAASKLLKYFINNYECERIISFADMEWSLGNLYYKLGFELKYITKPNYKYIINKKREHKQKFKKDILVRKGFDKNLSESKIMENLGYNKVYDCGQMKFEKVLG